MKRWILLVGLGLSTGACDDDGGGGGGSEGDGSLAGVCNPPCSPGFVCSDERICVPEGSEGDGGLDDDGSVEDAGGACENECEPGTVRCAGDALESCVDTTGNGCFAWGEPIACPEGESCSGGSCADPEECTDDCSEGDLRCGMNGVQACRADADSDPCLDWAPEEACADGETCANGECQAGPCDDECGAGTARCSAPLRSAAVIR